MWWKTWWLLCKHWTLLPGEEENFHSLRHLTDEQRFILPFYHISFDRVINQMLFEWILNFSILFDSPNLFHSLSYHLLNFSLSLSLSLYNFNSFNGLFPKICSTSPHPDQKRFFLILLWIDESKIYKKFSSIIYTDLPSLCDWKQIRLLVSKLHIIWPDNVHVSIR